MRGSSGFTLLEMLVVLAIIALTVTVSAGFSGLRPGTSLRRSALAVETALETSRSAAIIDGRARHVDIDLEARRVLPEGGQGIELGWLDAISGASLRQDRKTSESFRITFFPDGSSTGGELELTARGATTAISINWLSGEIALRAAKTGR